MSHFFSLSVSSETDLAGEGKSHFDIDDSELSSSSHDVLDGVRKPGHNNK